MFTTLQDAIVQSVTRVTRGTPSTDVPSTKRPELCYECLQCGDFFMRPF